MSTEDVHQVVLTLQGPNGLRKDTAASSRGQGRYRVYNNRPPRRVVNAKEQQPGRRAVAQYETAASHQFRPSSQQRMHPTDEQLVSAYARQGDDRAFQMLVERHQERIYGFLIGMVRDEDIANDLFQETFLKVIYSLRSPAPAYRNQGRFQAWALRIARNAALDHLRRQRRRVPPEAVQWEMLADTAPGAEEAVERAESSQRLEQCIARLSDEQREVLLLRHEAELTFREIAALTDCSINTALGRMRYALVNLRRMLGETARQVTVQADNDA